MYRSSDEGDAKATKRRTRVVASQLVAGYDGYVALDVPSLELSTATIYGLVGSNGAGKSTLLRSLAGLQRPIRGDVVIEGEALYRNGIGLSQHVGWMPDNAPVRVKTTVRATLEEALADDQPIDDVATIAARVRLSALLDAPCGGLSLGQRQRVALARLLLAKRALLLLDEPSNGVDPEGREALALLLRERASEGATVVVSSHALRELESFCDEFILLDRGRLSSAGRSTELLAHEEGRVFARWIVRKSNEDGAASVPSIDDALQAATRALSAIEGAKVLSATQDALEMIIPDRPDARRLALRALIAQGVPLLSFEPTRASLADAYARIARAR
ncbi:MAG: ABC transporter ATP-binding protein [Myxococcales bacterium]|nr:ABC transporter ATP-binding protein [Myxococcales bacterium]